MLYDLDSRGGGGYGPEFGDIDGIFDSIKSVAKKVGSTTSSVAKKVVSSGEKAGTLPFKAVGAVVSSGVRLASGIGKATGKIGGTILAAPVRVSMEATKGVIGGARGTIGKITNPFAKAPSTQQAALEVAQSQGMAPGGSPPPAAPPPGGVTSSTSALSTTPAEGGATFDVGAAQKALAQGATPDQAMQAGEDAAAEKAGMPMWQKLALGGGVAIAAFLGYRMLRRRGGGRRKS